MNYIGSTEPHRKAVTAVQGDQERLRHFLWTSCYPQGLVAQCFFDLLVRTLSPEDLNHLRSTANQ